MWGYILIPLVTIAVALSGGRFVSLGLADWYKTIRLPFFTPSGAIIGAIWTVIYILTAASAIIVWRKIPHDDCFWIIIAVFILNGLLNILWCYLFFTVHLMPAAVIESAILGLTVVFLIVLIWPFSKLAAGLLVAYALWVGFATYLAYAVWHLNP